MRELEGIPLLLDQCNVDDHNPCILILIQLISVIPTLCAILYLHIRSNSLIKSFFLVADSKPQIDLLQFALLPLRFFGTSDLLLLAA